MLKKTITYTDYNDQQITEDLYFNLTKLELMELESSKDGKLSETLVGIAERNETHEIISMVKDLILMSYGIKSEDGKRFIKNEKLREEFSQSEAFSELFMEICTDANGTMDFITNIMPASIRDDIINNKELQKKIHEATAAAPK